jgi:hypothetical protein
MSAPEATTSMQRQTMRPFVVGGAVGMALGIVLGCLIAALASRTLMAALRSWRRRSNADTEPPFEFLAQ